MARLEPLMCPNCGAEIFSDEFTPGITGGAPIADCYAACLRRCASCGIGFSNARHAAHTVRIYSDPLRNIPEPARAGALDILGSALNLRNRANKRSKFGFETSEDAVTWTVFTYLYGAGVWPLQFVGRLDGARHTTLLLWGTPFPITDASGHDLRKRVISVLDKLGEDPGSYSEPDVILDFGAAGIVIVEVKYRSPNDNKPIDYRGWDTYLDQRAFVDPKGVRRSGHYELARNWRLGCELAQDRRLTVINLGPPDLFDSGTGAQLRLFETSLRLGPDRRFQRLTWPTFLGAIKEMPDWFREYLLLKRLVDRTE